MGRPRPAPVRLLAASPAPSIEPGWFRFRELLHAHVNCPAASRSSEKTRIRPRCLSQADIALAPADRHPQYPALGARSRHLEAKALSVLVDTGRRVLNPRASWRFEGP
jgi:hypothetical protein